MKESDQFRELREGIVSRKRKVSEPRAVEDGEEKDSEREISQGERARMIAEIMTPELRSGYDKIAFALKGETWVDVDNFEGPISEWIVQLKQSVSDRGLSEGGDLDVLEGEVWNFFDSLGRTLNTYKVVKKVDAYYKTNKINASNREAKAGKVDELVERLADEYQLSKAEASIIAELAEPEDARNNYNLGVLLKTIKEVWQEYEVGQDKGALAKIAMGRIVTKLAENIAPYLLKDVIEGNELNASVVLESIGVRKIGDLAGDYTDIFMGRFMNGIDLKINVQMANLLFYQEFDFTQTKSIGELVNTMERGKMAIGGLLQNVLEDVGPTAAGLAMSATFLASIHPLMGAAGIASMPVMFYLSKRHNAQRRELRQTSRDAADRIETRQNATKEGFEEIKVSPNLPEIVADTREVLNEGDRIALESFILRRKQSIKEALPWDISGVISLVVGALLQREGLVSGGAILSQMQYTSLLTRPLVNVFEGLYGKFAEHVENIEKLRELFGDVNDLDTPEGKREQERVSVGELQDYGIKVAHLNVKGILQDVSLEVESGEFAVIAGPSGAGKTTLLRALAGIYRPNNGDIKIGDVPASKIKRYGSESLYTVMAYASQKPKLLPDLSLRENIVLWSGKNPGDQEIKAVLEELGLEKLGDKLDEKTPFLSGGELVRVGLARVLLRDPKILLLDEPTASLDDESAQNVIDVIMALRSARPEMTTVCVSHDPRLMATGRVINIKDIETKS